MKKILLSVTAVFCLVTGVKAQNSELLYCGHNKYVDECKARGFDPDHDPGIQYLEEFTRNFDPSMAIGSYTRESQVIYIIPIVFHIVHMNGVENISDAQVFSAVEVLNRDYNKLNPDTASVVSAFSGNVANVGFEFRLAQKDALGNCTKGITRTYSINTWDGGYDAVDDVNRNLNNSSTNTNNVRFPRDMYLNVWVLKDLGDAAGYTNTPSGWTPSKYDGIWLQHSYCGNIGTANYTTSRALTHEIGHWMNLSHVWGNTNEPGVSCGDDNVSDTPVTKGWSTCNLTGKTCTSDPSPVDNVQNFMEYSYCSRMFTNGQKTRMIAAINSSTGQRNELWQTANLNATGVNQTPALCAADFTSDRIVICEGESVDFTDYSYSDANGWNWTFTGGTPASSTSQNPTVSYATAGTYAVTLTATDGTSNDTETKNAYITVLPAIGKTAPFTEDFEAVSSIPNNDWMVDNPDGGYGWNLITTTGYSGTKSLKLQSASITSGHIDEFMSNTIDLSGMSSVLVTFKYSFVQKNASNSDILKVYVSNDCGESWTLRKQISSANLSTGGIQLSQFTPSSTSQWAESQITNISASYLTDNFRIKWSFESGGGNNLYIDDINISWALSTDELTADFGLSAYPNPLDEQTTLQFNLTNETNVDLSIYDVIGKNIMNVAKGNLGSGAHSYTIDASELNAGVYFVKLKAGNREMVKKIIIH